MSQISDLKKKKNEKTCLLAFSSEDFAKFKFKIGINFKFEYLSSSEANMND
jgi:hypothetical protein